MASLQNGSSRTSARRPVKRAVALATVVALSVLGLLAGPAGAVAPFEVVGTVERAAGPLPASTMGAMACPGATVVIGCANSVQTSVNGAGGYNLFLDADVNPTWTVSPFSLGTGALFGSPQQVIAPGGPGPVVANFVVQAGVLDGRVTHGDGSTPFSVQSGVSACPPPVIGPGCAGGVYKFGDANGDYVIALPLGAFNVAGFALGGGGPLSGTHRSFSIADGATLTGEDFVVSAQAVEGMVTDGAAPFVSLSGAYFCPAPGSGASCPGARFGLADPGGNYSAVLPSGTYNAAGFTDAGAVSGPSQVVIVGDSETPVTANFVVPAVPVASGTVTGSVTAAGGGPFTGTAAVFACSGTGPVVPGCPGLDFEVATPGYTLTLPPGEWTLLAARYNGSIGPVPDEATPEVTLDVVDGESITCDFEFGGAAPVCDVPAPQGTVVVTVDEAPGASYAPGFCADPGLPVMFSTTCTDSQPLLGFQVVDGGSTYVVSLPEGDYSAAIVSLSPAAMSPVISVEVVAGETLNCSFTMAAGPVCVEDPDPEVGTVIVTVDEAPGASYVAGFCAAPGLPVLGSSTCSDAAPVLGFTTLAGGASGVITLLAGSYNAAMALTSPLSLSAIGAVEVVAGETFSCSFTMAAGPDCEVVEFGTLDVTIDEAPGDSYIVGVCADPGLPVLGSTICSDSRPALGFTTLNGGDSASMSIPVGSYSGAMASLSPVLALSAIGPVDVIAGQTTTCSFTMAAGPDCDVDDGDGVSEAVEDAAPNGGDGNNDGIADSLQTEVSSLPAAVGGGYVTVASPDGTLLADVSVIDPDSLPLEEPVGVTFPGGLVSFTVEGVDVGGTVDVDVIFHNATAPDAYYKFHDGAWLDFSANAAIVGNVATLTLTDGEPGDDDGIANGSIVDPGGLAVTASVPTADATVDEGDTGKETVELTVTVATRTTPTTKVKVDWCTADDTATADVDYDQKCGQVTLNKNEASQVIKVKVRSDLLVEADEDFLVNLTATGGTLTKNQFRVRIVDNDTPIDNDVDVTEGDHGTKQVKLTVIPATRATPNTVIGVDWCTDDGTATEPSDYKQKCKHFTMGKNAKKHTIQVAVRGDTVDELNEDFFVNLTATGGTLVHNQYRVQIVDDE